MNEQKENELRMFFNPQKIVDIGVPENVFYSKLFGISCFFEPSKTELDRWDWSTNTSDTSLAAGSSDSFVDALDQCREWFIKKLSTCRF